MKIEWQQPLIDAAIVVGGGSLINTYIIGNIAALAGIVAKFPVIIGISTSAILVGAIALITAKSLMK